MTEALSARNLHAIVESAPVAIAIFDHELRYLLHSAVYRDAFGLGDEPLIGRHHYEVFPDLPAAYREVHQRCLAGAIERGEREPLMHPSGRVDWTNWHAFPWYAESGEVGGIVVISEIITKLVEQQEALVSLNQQLQKVHRLARIGYWEWDAVEDRNWWSDDVFRVFGQTPKSHGPSRAEYLQIVHPEDREAFTSALDAALASGEHFQVEHKALLPDRSVRHVVLSAQVVRNKTTGEAMRFIGAAQDVTERRLLEEQLREAQKMEATGQLAGGVAHDFNNILTAIFSFSQFALEAVGVDHRAYDDIREVLRAAGQAKSLTSQLLAFSRRHTVVPKVLQINERVRNVEAMMKRLLGEDIQYATHLADDLWNTRIDPNVLEQVIVNLAVNARDAMAGGGKLTIETSNIRLEGERIGAKGQRIPAGDYVVFQISDDGRGMPVDVQEHIFEPFFTTKEPGSGTGLGLSMCFGIVRQAGGFMWVYSEEGEGTTFKIYLPRVMESVELDEPEATRPIVRGRELVLVAEDSEQLRTVTRRALERQGYEVLVGATGAEALSLLESCKRPIDLLVTDVIMPGMNGKQLADEVCRRYPNVRVLYMSGYSENTIVHHGVLEPGILLLQKPFTPAELTQRVQEILQSPAAVSGPATE